MACNCRFEEAVRGAEGRTSGCSGNARTRNDGTEIFGREARNLGPYTWNGYVWYEVEVEFTGPYFEENRNNGRNRNNGCGCRCSCGCGCRCCCNN